ncbi:MAG: dprA [Nevskia sp.]|nr:dprA [Nevskia sp.]
MAPADLRHWLALLRVAGLGPSRGARLLQRFGDPRAVFAAGAAAWRGAGIVEELCVALGQPDWAAVDEDLRWLDGATTSSPRGLLTRDDARYPEALAEIAQAPLALFYRGDADLLQTPQLAVVGARAASAQGVENAQAFAAEIARRGLTITSGLALGIDAAAHRGALAAQGLTIAVCGNGLDRIYPARNKDLAHAIAERGLLISEFAPGEPPKPENFPRRNRIISGLSLGVLVVEAARESGSLITARLAAEQGREVFAIPGSIHNPLARGCHALIREGARLTETVDDILAELAPQLRLPAPVVEPGTESAASTIPADDLQRRVLSALGHEAVSLERLIERVGAPVEQITAALLNLELEGQVVAAPGDVFSRLQR